RPAGERVVDGLAIHLGGARHVVVALGATFDLQRVHAHLHQALHVLHGTQVLGVHDVGAMLVLGGFHELARTGHVFQQEDLIGRRADPQGRVGGLHGDRLVLVHHFAQLVFLGLVSLVLPAAGVGAGALVGIALV